MTGVRIGDDGFREAWCPICFRYVGVTSLRDDTRWRYAPHTTANREPCPLSGELVTVLVKGGCEG